MMKILVCGGSGFIGRNIVEQFSNRYDILAPSRREMDLADEESVRSFIKQKRIDIVIHAAGKPGHRNVKDPTGVFIANTRMFFNLVQCAGYFSKMLVIGSGAIYDMRHYHPKMKEEYFGTHIPVDEHGFSRYACGKFIQNSRNIIDLRVFGIFGKYEDYAIRFISNLICKAIFDLPLTMKQNRRFDYIYINDLMSILEHFITTEVEHREYNITPDNAIELYVLAEKIRSISGKKLPIVVAESGMGLEYSGDNSRLRRAIPNIGFTSFDDAIEKLYHWYESISGSIDRNVLLVDK